MKETTRKGDHDKPLLSLCMIVKDEEDMLPGALESIVPWVDEVVVVDTGSTDKTVEIAESFGARVYVHPWQKNFSLHRNQSLSYANGEWIVYIDADERLDPESGPRLKQVLKNAKPETDSFLLHLVNWTRDGQNMGSANLMRMFRNNKIIHFEGIVHNNLVGYKETEAVDILIHHYGYDLELEKKHKKYERTTELLQKMLDEDPGNPVPHHYLAASHLNVQKFEEAAREAEQAIHLARTREIGSQLLFWSYHIASLCNFLLARHARAEELCLEALAKNNDHLDSHAVLCSVYTVWKRWEKVLEHANEYLRIMSILKEKPQFAGLQVLNTERHEWRIHLQKGIAFLETGFQQRAHDCFDRAVDTAANRAECLYAIGEYLDSTGRTVNAISYLAASVAEDMTYSKSSELLARRVSILIDMPEAYKTLELAVDAMLSSLEHREAGLAVAARTSLRAGDANGLVSYLGSLLSMLGIEPSSTAESMQDLATLCSEAAQRLWSKGKVYAAKQALKLGLDLNPADPACIQVAAKFMGSLMGEPAEPVPIQAGGIAAIGA